MEKYGDTRKEALAEAKAGGASVLSVSPALLENYLSAARTISPRSNSSDDR